MDMFRTLSPAAAPLDWQSLGYGFAGIFFPRRFLSKRENELRRYFKVKYVFPVSSGKAALACIVSALHSLETGKNDVLIPAYTCFSVPAAVLKAGLQVSLCDIDGNTFDYNFDELSSRVNAKTLCIIASHLFGAAADMERLRGFCAEKGIFLVEDAAQAMGVRRNGRMLGTIGDAGFFSFGRGKNVSCGSGGIIVTDNDAIARAIEKRYLALAHPRLLGTIKEYISVLLTSVFVRPSLYWIPASLSFLKLGETIFDPNFRQEKMSGMKAGLLTNWRERLEKSNRIRTDNGENLRLALDGGVYGVPGSPCIRLPYAVKNKRIKENILGDPRAKKLGISGMYPSPIHEINELKNRFGDAKFPAAKERADLLVTLPTHEFLSARDKQNICSFLRHHA
jgi:perosamine synthetase